MTFCLPSLLGWETEGEGGTHAKAIGVALESKIIAKLLKETAERSYDARIRFPFYLILLGSEKKALVRVPYVKINLNSMIHGSS